MKDICVLILAAGYSSRFWPLKDKHFVNFLGKPLIYYSISQLSRFGFTDLVIVVNKTNKSQFANFKEEFPNVSFTFVEQGEIKGMAGAVISAAKYISGKKLLVVGPADIYEDTLFDSFSKIIKTHPDGILVGTTTNKYFPGGYLTIDNGRVTKITEKPEPDATPSNIVNFVFDYIENTSLFLDTLAATSSKKDNNYEEAIAKLLTRGMNFRYLPYKGYWGYLKYPWHVLSVSSFFLEKLNGKKVKKAEIADTALIDGNVVIEDNVKIMENVKINGPSYIGYGTVIGQNCLIRESMIGSNCVVGYSTEIARSHIGNNCWFHHNYVGDSVIANNVSMGAGAVTANFRFDEKSIPSRVDDKKIDTGKVKLGAIIADNARIGVNASIMPGIKIGEKSIVGPAVLLDNDLPDGKFCMFGKK
jgi:bifunctional UDP-N-acetylglucosamine pyrophosphorylase/glucosamine-1-phosphate N-acetyltransferase